MAKKSNKAKTDNKALKNTTENKSTAKPKATDWNSMPERVTIIGLGGKHLTKDKEYPNTPKANAELLVNKGVAKLK